jgi:hypothetical protein
MFGDLRDAAVAVFRITTHNGVYAIGIHTDGITRHVIVRGESSPNQVVIIRDTDPRIDEHSLFVVPPSDWIGKHLRVATMTTSPIQGVVAETDPVAISAVGRQPDDGRSPWARPGLPHPTPPAGTDTLVDPIPSSTPVAIPGGSGYSAPVPAGLPDNPRIVPQGARGTMPVDQARALQLTPAAKALVVGGGKAPFPATPPAQPAYQPKAPPPSSGEVDLPYPQRHLHYAESIVQLFRSISRRDRLFDDLSAAGVQYRQRMRAALDECATLLEQIRRRDR